MRQKDLDKIDKQVESGNQPTSRCRFFYYQHLKSIQNIEIITSDFHKTLSVPPVRAHQISLRSGNKSALRNGREVSEIP